MSDISLETSTVPLYHEVADRIIGLIDSGTYPPGSRIPSIRMLSQNLAVSINTVREAYWLLETRRIIEGRSQSGYFVRRRIPARPSTTFQTDREIAPRVLDPCTLCTAAPLPDTPYKGWALALGSPDPKLFPVRALSARLAAVAREANPSSVAYAASFGMETLRREIARQSVEAGIFLSPEDFLVTSGCLDAISLAIEATCLPGDTVALESPAYHDFLALLQSKGLKVLEIPATSEEGINLDVLEWALANHPVKVVLSIPTHSNPIGGTLPEDRRQALVTMLARRGIPLIEDDTYGELSYAGPRPRACKSWDTDGSVIYCSSISKTLAPGYRVGWVSGGRWHEQLCRLKRLYSGTAPSPTQMAVAAFFRDGNYSRHLRQLRARLAEQAGAMSAVIAEHFPSGTRLSRPHGGFFLWVELPSRIDSMSLYEESHLEGVYFRPGRIFSASGAFGNCLRLCSGTWNPDVEAALVRLGQMACARA
jgi:DNA-binding transcriptional MocR family regulator